LAQGLQLTVSIFHAGSQARKNLGHTTAAKSVGWVELSANPIALPSDLDGFRGQLSHPVGCPTGKSLGRASQDLSSLNRKIF
jgi:hypothetical protein